MQNPSLRTVVVGVGLLSGLLIVGRHCALADVESPRVVVGRDSLYLIVGPSMNAVGSRLDGCAFVGQDLSGATFEDADLAGAYIVDCDLSFASFKGAQLAEAYIRDCNLEGADFTDATINGLKSSIELTAAQLMSTRSYQDKDLSYCIISIKRSSTAIPPADIDFSGANLSHAGLGSDLTGCDFRDAIVEGARLAGRIEFTQFASTRTFRRRIYAINFGTSLVGQWNFSGADLRGSEFHRVSADMDFTGAIISQCSVYNGLSREQVYSTRSYRNGDLTNLSWSRFNLRGWDLSGANLTGSRFSECDFTDVNFEDAVITRVNFYQFRTYGYKGLTAEQIRSTWNYKQGRMEGIILPEEVAAALGAESDRQGAEE